MNLTNLYRTSKNATLLTKITSVEGYRKQIKERTEKRQYEKEKKGMRIATGHQGTLHHLRKAVEASRAFCENQENHIALYNLTESLQPLFTHQAHRGEDVISFGFAREKGRSSHHVRTTTALSGGPRDH